MRIVVMLLCVLLFAMPANAADGQTAMGFAHGLYSVAIPEAAHLARQIDAQATIEMHQGFEPEFFIASGYSATEAHDAHIDDMFDGAVTQMIGHAIEMSESATAPGGIEKQWGVQIVDDYGLLRMNAVDKAFSYGFLVMWSTDDLPDFDPMALVDSFFVDAPRRYRLMHDQPMSLKDNCYVSVDSGLALDLSDRWDVCDAGGQAVLSLENARQNAALRIDKSTTHAPYQTREALIQLGAREGDIEVVTAHSLGDGEAMMIAPSADDAGYLASFSRAGFCYVGTIGRMTDDGDAPDPSALKAILLSIRPYDAG